MQSLGQQHLEQIYRKDINFEPKADHEALHEIKLQKRKRTTEDQKLETCKKTSKIVVKIAR